MSVVAQPCDTPRVPDDLDRALLPTEFLDWTSTGVRAFADRAVGDADSPRDEARRLFLAVRDGFRYDPYTVSPKRDDYRASVIVEGGATWCVPKALLLAAVGRARGIPARVGFADVRNHLQSERLRERMGSDLFVYHGYAELFVEGRWVKATPAFDVALCHRLGVDPLDFDGSSDALLQPYTPDGARSMEYVRDRGTRDEFPFDEVMHALAEHYGFAGATGPVEDPTFSPADG